VLYKLFFKLVFRNIDPEQAHYLGMFLIKSLGRLGILSLFKDRSKHDLHRVMGLEFVGPFGLAAGFDKNAEVVFELGQLGFSHVEVGTVTRYAQPGNEKPRLFRLPGDKALINRMGFNNDGADEIAERLKALRESSKSLPVIGVNIGKSKITEIADAEADYRYSAKRLAPFADYLAVNVSSPNTPGLRSLQAVEQLEPILRGVKQESLGKPVLVKIAPDLADDEALEIAQLVLDLDLAGVIATNTTVQRTDLVTSASKVQSMGQGGLSGPVLAKRSIEILKILRSALGPEKVVISVGGVFSKADVRERLELGADLVQGYTGFVYEGLSWAGRLNSKN
jgi:dihydroorotate dehydrogenase